MTTAAVPPGYDRTARVLHWISALLVLVLIGSGFRAGLSTDPEAKAAALRVHLPVAILVLVLTAARLVRWWRHPKAAPVPGTPPWQEAAARWTHRGLTTLLIALLGSGIATSALSGLPAALFGPAPMPDLADLPPRTAHGVAARVLLALVLLHVGAALYRHVVRKDRTLVRMWRGTGREGRGPGRADRTP